MNFGKEIQALNKWTQSALSAAANYFEKLLEAKAKGLLKLLPAVAILTNPKIPTTKSLQVAILDNPERDNVAGAVVSLHKLHESAKTLNSKITNFLPKETLAELKSTLDHGKLSVGVEYALRQVLSLHDKSETDRQISLMRSGQRRHASGSSSPASLPT